MENLLRIFVSKRFKDQRKKLLKLVLLLLLSLLLFGVVLAKVI
jgi:hypothetical protein